MDQTPWVRRMEALVSKFDKQLPMDSDNHGNTFYEAGPYLAWKTQARVALVGLLGESHPYVEHFDDVEGFRDSDGSGARALVEAVLEDLREGYLFQTLKGLLTAEVFSDLLEMAEHLLEQGYKDAAAPVVGAVLEDGLRRIASKAGTTGRNLGTLNDACLRAGVYGRLVHQQVTVWITLRNKADHGEYGAYDIGQVQDMHRGVSQFLATHLTTT